MRSLQAFKAELNVKHSSEVTIELIPATMGSGPVTSRAQAEEAQKAGERRKGTHVARSSHATIPVTLEESRALVADGAKDGAGDLN